MANEKETTKDDVQAYMTYFKENVPEDEDVVKTICEAASIPIYNIIKIRIDEPELLGAIFGKIYEACLLQLKELEETHSDFTIDICHRLQIGYTTSADEDDEKEGNFMIFIRHVGESTTAESKVLDDPDSKPIDRAVQWNTENVIDQPKLIRDISLKAVDLLKDIHIELGSSEFIMPIFVLIYEMAVSTVVRHRREINKFEYEINFISCFNIGARETENGIDDIYIRPSIQSKLLLKNDQNASSKYE